MVVPLASPPHASSRSSSPRSSSPRSSSPQPAPASGSFNRRPSFRLGDSFKLRDWWADHRARATKTIMLGIVVFALVAALISGLLARATSATNTVPVIERLPRADRGGATADPAAPLAGTDAARTEAAGTDAAGTIPPSATSSTTDGGGSTTKPPTLVVHAAGAVTNPGVYVFGPGARVADLLSAAGGVRGDADLDRINLAAQLVDSSRVFVPRLGEVVPATVAVELGAGTPTIETGAVADAGRPINLNSATVEQLDGLPGVGPATAAAIIEHRTKVGRFRSVGQLLDVPGIGEAKLASLRSKVVV